MRELQGAIEPLGTPLLNIATNVAGVVKSFGEWFDGIGEGGQMAVLAIAGILAAIGPVLSVAGNLVSVVPAVTAAITAAGGATGLLSGAMAALTGPVGIVIGAVAGLAAALVYCWNTSEAFRAGVTSAWQLVCGAVSQAFAIIQPLLASLADFLVGGSSRRSLRWPPASATPSHRSSPQPPRSRRGSCRSSKEASTCCSAPYKRCSGSSSASSPGTGTWRGKGSSAPSTACLASSTGS
ncbi:MAG: hypothetical protein ACLRRW_08140 [Collinsella intestinalis]